MHTPYAPGANLGRLRAANPVFGKTEHPMAWEARFVDYNLADIRAFVQVVDDGSITAAANRLGIAKSSLSARITRLEAALHVQLLHRSAHGAAVTDAGRRFHARMLDLLGGIQQAADEAAGGDGALAGNLRITAPVTFGAQYLGRPVFGFVARHPELAITLNLEDRYVDLAAEGFDLGVRIGRLADSSLMARRIARSPRVLCCSPDYAAERALPKRIEDIQQHPCIAYGNASSTPFWQFASARRGGEPRQIAVRGRVYTNSGEGMRDAAVAGLGLAILPLFIAGPALAAGQLQVVLPRTPPTEDAIHVVYPPTRYVSRAVRRLIDTLVDHFRDFEWSRNRPRQG
jgi:DNA-binding transcriptional LysR family regulator